METRKGSIPCVPNVERPESEKTKKIVAVIVSRDGIFPVYESDN